MIFEYQKSGTSGDEDGLDLDMLIDQESASHGIRPKSDWPKTICKAAKKVQNRLQTEMRKRAVSTLSSIYNSYLK